MSIKTRARSFLQTVGNHLGTDMVYVTRGSFWLVFSRGIGIITSLGLAATMANLIPSNVFGIYKFVVSGAGIVGSISLLNVGPAITRSVARGFDGSLAEGARATLWWSMLSIAISFFVAAYYYINGNTVLALSFLIAGLFMPAINATSLVSNFLAGKKDFRVFSIFESVRISAPSLILIATVLFTENVILIVISYFASTALVTYLLFLTTLQKYRANDDVDPTMVEFGRHLGLMGFLGKLPEHLDKILVFHYLGATQLAVYIFALTPISHIKLLNDIPARLMMPKMPVRGLSELQVTLPRKVLLISFTMLVIVLVYVALAPFIFSVLFPRYMDAVLYSQVLAFSLVLAPGSLYGEALTSQMVKKELYVSQILIPTIRIALYLVLLPFFGIWGAIAATILNQAFMFCLNAWLFSRADRSHS